MPTPYENLAPYLRPGRPEESANESSIGSTYEYRGDTTTINTNKPGVGDTWADGRPVVAARVFEISGASAKSDLVVVTGAPVGGGTLGTPVVERTEYELEWRPVTKPLEVHPAFITGGTYALDETARKHIFGWKAEVDPALRSQRKYKPLDSAGTPGSTVTISGNALVYIKLYEIGVEEFIDYMPVWRKRSIYKGDGQPTTGAIGVKTTTPSGSGYPSGYEWVKSKDSALRMGSQARWRRDEEWEGAITVYVDKGSIYPPS
jgi:hypothetical protein